MISDLPTRASALDPFAEMGPVFHNSPIAIIVWDPATQLIVKGNPAAWGLYGYSQDEFCRLSLQKLCSEVSPLKSSEHVRKDGGKITVDTSGCTVHLEGKNAQILFVADRTEPEKNERRLREALIKAEANLKSKAGFVSTISREIRTPLNGVIGMAAMLAETNLNVEQQDFLGTIRSSSEVISDILDYVRIEEQKLNVEFTDFELQSVISSVFDNAQVNASQKKLEMKSVIAENVPKRLNGDPDCLKQILSNLVSNAVKFTEAGSVTLSVSLSSIPPSVMPLAPVLLRFEVADTGAGILPDVSKLLTHSLTQAETTIAPRFGGAGLGLAICKRLVDLMGGQIGLESTPGKGSSFWFTASLNFPAALPAADATGILAGRKILLVQANAEERAAARRLLETMRLVVTEAGNAAQAVSFCSARRESGGAFSLALVDWNLPVIDGIRFAQLLREEEKNKNIKVVLLTPLLTPNQLAEARDAGVADVITKPLSEPQLFKAFSEALAATILPAVEIAVPPAAPPAATAGSEKSNANILIVEDNHVNQLVASLCLQKLGYAVQIAEDGLAALDAFSKQHFDLILMDCHMPRMDGVTATKRIRELGGFGQKIPILALTANVFQSECDRCLAAGMNDFLSKPIRADILKGKLEFWLRQSK